VFVLPSEGESFGLVAAEAAAAGTPVVVTDRCGVAEFLGENGALVVPFERIALAAAIRRALDDGELRRRLRAGGRAAAERWSPDAVVARQEEIYRRALAP
jgi:glycosyltransferase involved in cell wall biosynthesis